MSRRRRLCRVVRAVHAALFVVDLEDSVRTCHAAARAWFASEPARRFSSFQLLVCRDPVGGPAFDPSPTTDCRLLLLSIPPSSFGPEDIVCMLYTARTSDDCACLCPHGSVQASTPFRRIQRLTSGLSCFSRVPDSNPSCLRSSRIVPFPSFPLAPLPPPSALLHSCRHLRASLPPEQSLGCCLEHPRPISSFSRPTHQKKLSSYPLKPCSASSSLPLARRRRLRRPIRLQLHPPLGPSGRRSSLGRSPPRPSATTRPLTVPSRLSTRLLSSPAASRPRSCPSLRSLTLSASWSSARAVSRSAKLESSTILVRRSHTYGLAPIARNAADLLSFRHRSQVRRQSRL